jgi:hypothetical protein
MKTKLTLTVDRAKLSAARRKLQRRGRSISAEVDALLERIASETETNFPLWSERFGDMVIPLDMELAESDTPTGRQLRKTAAYRQAKAAARKKKP